MVKTRSQSTMADSDNAELLALLAEMKKSMEAGQEEMRIRQEEMKKGMEKGQDEMRVHVETQVEEIKEHVNTCIGKIEEDVQSVKREINETQFDVVSSLNGWTGRVKASQLVASLRGSAAEVLQGIPAGNLMDLTTIERALESRFGDSHLTQFYRT
ncbi:CCHC-type domain-containing protein [Nephila pilipes]|uniref:CCHC-type domain-containing protein n=1 Tax=Nephila pilipes TaxID=299642 RepID=A0A8X6PLP8_NEPPI|nr:CCHC-type domain-containing protein [Nephila pilipes]